MLRYCSSLGLLLLLSFSVLAQQDTIKRPLCSLMYSGYFRLHNEYPPFALENCISGITQMKFMVDTNGVVSDISVLSGVSTVLDNEAKQVLMASSGKWAPGTVNGVRTNMYTVHVFNYHIYNDNMQGIAYNNIDGTTYTTFANCNETGCDIWGKTADCGHSERYYYNEGVKLYEKGYNKEALKLFEKATLMNYNDVHALYNIAVIYINQGEAEFACPSLYRIRKIGGKDVREMISKFCDTTEQ